MRLHCLIELALSFTWILRIEVVVTTRNTEQMLLSLDPRVSRREILDRCIRVLVLLLQLRQLVL